MATQAATRRSRRTRPAPRGRSTRRAPTRTKRPAPKKRPAARRRTAPKARKATRRAPRRRRSLPKLQLRQRLQAMIPAEHRADMWGLALIGIGLVLALALYMGAGGPVGGWLTEGMRIGVGRATGFVPVALVGLGLALILNHRIAASAPMKLGLVLLAAAGLGALAGGAFGGPPRTAWFAHDSVFERGGHFGELVYFAASSALGGLGAAVLLGLLGVAGAVLVSGASLGQILEGSGRGAATASRGLRGGVSVTTSAAVRETQRLRGFLKKRRDIAEDPTLPRAAIEDDAIDVATIFPVSPLDGEDDYPEIYSEKGDLPPSPALGLDTADEATGEVALPPLEAVAPVVDEPSAPKAPATEIDEEDESGEEDAERIPYRLPPARLLRRSRRKGGISDAVVQDTTEKLEEALSNFGVEATVTDAVRGPRVTRYELRLAPGTKVGRISSLKDDLAYALAARDEIRIIAPIPGKQAVGVEVPNPEARLITLGDIFDPLEGEKSPLATWVGLDLGGGPVWIDLAKMPHILIAGSTGTGKSVSLNAILTSILLRSSPDDLRMILVDPKKVELNHYEGIPHLLTPVVTNMKDAAAVLANVVKEMENRYEMMGLDRARNLPDWNEIREARGDRRIPSMLVVIDELADLMMVAPAEVEDAIIRLAQKSRAVGIHLVLATQRPSVDVITGMIKANVPSRIAFAVSSQVDSRVVLDSPGAESLLGQGDMLFRPVGTSKLQRLQGAYVSESETQQVTEYWRRQGKPEMRKELLERPEPAETGPDKESDEMLSKAIELVVQQGTASVSLIQRRLGVGYARAGRLVDAMEDAGVVSGHEGSKPRRVLIGEVDLPRFTGGNDDSDDSDSPEGSQETLDV